MKSRNYGIYLGDRVKLECLGNFEEVTVVKFDPYDNNACRVSDKDGKYSKQVCEWLERIPPEGYLDFYPVQGLQYSVLVETVDSQPSLSTVEGTNLYVHVARLIYNYKKVFVEYGDRLKRVFIYVQESPSDLSQELYQVFEDADAFHKAIQSYEKILSERMKIDAKKTTEKE